MLFRRLFSSSFHCFASKANTKNTTATQVRGKFTTNRALVFHVDIICWSLGTIGRPVLLFAAELSLASERVLEVSLYRIECSSFLFCALIGGFIIPFEFARSRG
jgi:hypothetical protein